MLELVSSATAEPVGLKTDSFHRQRIFDSNLCDSAAYQRFRRNAEMYEAHTMPISLQQWPTVIAFVGCIVLFVFCSATWWYSKVTTPKVLIAYAAQLVVLIAFLLLKAIQYRRTSTFKSERPVRGGFNGFTARLNDLVRFLTKPSAPANLLTDQILQQGTKLRNPDLWQTLVVVKWNRVV